MTVKDKPIHRSFKGDHLVKEFLNNTGNCLKMDTINRPALMKIMDKIVNLQFKNSSEAQQMMSNLMVKEKGDIDSHLLRSLIVAHHLNETLLDLLMKAGDMKHELFHTEKEMLDIRKNMIIDYQNEMDLRILPDLRS